MLTTGLTIGCAPLVEDWCLRGIGQKARVLEERREEVDENSGVGCVVGADV
jgi:hypothetical protein